MDSAVPTESTLNRKGSARLHPWSLSGTSSPMLSGCASIQSFREVSEVPSTWDGAPTCAPIQNSAYGSVSSASHPWLRVHSSATCR
eukprot:scaffold519_cov331-Pavlova_lutheri.AAC.22